MANVENYGWAYVHPTASQAQARGVDKSIQFLTGALDGNGIGMGSGSANFTFDYSSSQLVLTGNMSASGHISASFFHGDGSNLTNVGSGQGFPFTGDAVITGTLHVTNAITASNYLIENTFEVNSSGSSTFGNTDDAFTTSDEVVTTKTTSIDSTTSNNSRNNNGTDAFDSAFDAFPGEDNKVETTNGTGDGGDDDPFSSFGDF